MRRTYWLGLLVIVLLAGCLGGGTQSTLTVERQGEGTVTPSVGPHTYDKGTMVTLTANPAGGWEFSHWDGPVTDRESAQTQVLMDNNKTVKAVFEETAGPGPVEQSSHTAGDVGFDMRLAPAATFPTGTDDSGEATIDTPFWISETQVTYELWWTVRQWALDNGYTFANAGREGSHGNLGQPPSQKGNEPVTQVSWRDSIVWTNALSEMLDFAPVYTYQGTVIKDSTNATACDNATHENNSGFRLPTNNEWELAARYKGNDSSHGAIPRDGLWWTPGNYPSGATDSISNAVAIQEVAWYHENSNGDGSVRKTQDVGSLRANGLGVYDMSGNVWERTFTENQVGYRLVRGGSYISHPNPVLQVGSASSMPPDNFSSDFGLRLARTHF